MRQKGWLQGVIEERRRNFSSWVWLGHATLGFFLEGVKRSFREPREEQWVWNWKEDGTKYLMVKGANHACPFVRLKVFDAG